MYIPEAIPLVLAFELSQQIVGQFSVLQIEAGLAEVEEAWHIGQPSVPHSLSVVIRESPHSGVKHMHAHMHACMNTYTHFEWWQHQRDQQG